MDAQRINRRILFDNFFIEWYTCCAYRIVDRLTLASRFGQWDVVFLKQRGKHEETFKTM